LGVDREQGGEKKTITMGGGGSSGGVASSMSFAASWKKKSHFATGRGKKKLSWVRMRGGKNIPSGQARFSYPGADPVGEKQLREKKKERDFCEGGEGKKNMS